MRYALIAGLFAGVLAFAPVAVGDATRYDDLRSGGAVGSGTASGSHDRRSRGEISRISCSDARDAVRDQGYQEVLPLNCSGRFYRFAASDLGDDLVVSVHARSGKVVSVYPSSEWPEP